MRSPFLIESKLPFTVVPYYSTMLGLTEAKEKKMISMSLSNLSANVNGKNQFLP